MPSIDIHYMVFEHNTSIIRPKSVDFLPLIHPLVTSSKTPKGSTQIFGIAFNFGCPTKNKHVKLQTCLFNSTTEMRPSRCIYIYIHIFLILHYPNISSLVAVTTKLIWIKEASKTAGSQCLPQWRSAMKGWETQCQRANLSNNIAEDKETWRKHKE